MMSGKIPNLRLTTDTTTDWQIPNNTSALKMMNVGCDKPGNLSRLPNAAVPQHQLGDRACQTMPAQDDGHRRMPEKRPADPLDVKTATLAAPPPKVVKIKEDLKTKAGNVLDEHFKDREFNFVEFAKINALPYHADNVQHSLIVEQSFYRMRRIVAEMLNSGITIDIETIRKTIELTPREVIDVYERIRTCGLNKDDKAYKLYSELSNIILGKLLKVAKLDIFVKNAKCFGDCVSTGYELYKNILQMPLVCFGEGMEMCVNIMRTTLVGHRNTYQLSEPLLSNAKRQSEKHQKLVNSFKKLGTFFAFEDNKLAKQILPAAKFATSIGMKIPLFMAEVTDFGDNANSYASPAAMGIAIRERRQFESMPEFHGFPRIRKSFYHEITHHARHAVGARQGDKSIARKNLTDVLKGHNDIISAIESQISDYALTNYEEYIAEFSALVLCCLEHNKNPFEHITDERLWRLYYEFGGPDFAPIINERNKGLLVRDMLNDPACDMVSGHPSKFGINLDGKQMKVSTRSTRFFGKDAIYWIDKEAILPPPPLGYCYKVKDQTLKLKDLESGIYYDPTFCGLTDGPLTLMNTEPALVHHFELLPAKSIGMPLKMFNEEAYTKAKSAAK